MTDEELKKLKQSALLFSVVEDETEPTAKSEVMKNVKGRIKSNPVNAAIWAATGIGVVISIGLLFAILSKLSPAQAPEITQALDNESAITGFDALTQQEQVESMKNQTSITEGQTAQYEVETAKNSGYYVSEALLNASILEYQVQLASTLYKLPVQVSQLEERGIALTSLGGQTPSEETALNAGFREGTVNVDGHEIVVQVRNTVECTYHDLTVVSFICSDEGAPMYIGQGIHIGSEEASLPDDFNDLITNDFTKRTAYKWDGVEGIFATTTGKEIRIETKDGKVIKIMIFNDNSAG